MSIRYVLTLICILPLWLSSVSAQITSRVQITQLPADSSRVVAIRWSTQDEQQWHQENDGRLDIMGFKADIHSADLVPTQSKVTSFGFQLQQFGSVEMLFNVTSIGVGEEVYLYDEASGKTICDLTKQTKAIFLSQVFNPETTKLIWKSPVTGTYKSEFVIKNVYLQKEQEERSRGIGFGTANACQPNTACKQDSMIQLISNSAVRIRLVMEEGIGWCTGSFVNNTRNDKTPYLLTAFHCQYEYTPIYDMWRFDFQYKSTTCENPITEPQYFSLTGCQLIASGQASDFLMVLLEDHIPDNQEVTFAGWDRSDTLIPDTSYLIHHPNADIRKISTTINPATIHPNQIGWSEGYTTPPSHHFRMKFTEGGHQPGSSGGPVFNEKGFLVGQLHGGTAGCEATNNAYVGRLAKSWNPGVSPQERLSDWLDPDQTGVTQLAAIENLGTSDIVDLHGLVTDGEGSPVKNAVIKVTGSVERTLTTGSDGVFEISGISRNGQYTITPSKLDNPLNGLNALDLVGIQKHILGKDTFDFSWQMIAADATNNIFVNVSDILILQKLILGKIQTLPSSPSWRFEPSQVTITSFPAGQPDQIQITGIKIGDVNGTSDPKK